MLTILFSLTPSVQGYGEELALHQRKTCKACLSAASVHTTLAPENRATGCQIMTNTFDPSIVTSSMDIMLCRLLLIIQVVLGG
jgi:hypothetical protein